MFWKIIFFKVWVIVFLLASVGIYMSLFDGDSIKSIFNVFVEESEKTEMIVLYIRAALLFVSGFLITAVFGKIKTLFFRAEEKSFKIAGENGDISISLSSFESIADGVVKNNYFIKDVKVKSGLTKSGVYLKIKVNSDMIENLNLEIQNIRESVIKNIKNTTGIEIEKLDIIVSKIIFKEDKKLPKREAE